VTTRAWPDRITSGTDVSTVLERQTRRNVMTVRHLA
jgi:hypothetical protein